MTLLVPPPLYLLESVQPCVVCARTPPVIGLAAHEVFEDGERHGERRTRDALLVLSETSAMPAELLAMLQRANPLYRWHRSPLDDRCRYTNLCPCGAPLLDRYLVAMEDGAFHFDDESRLHRARMRELAIDGSVRIEGGWTFSSGIPPRAHAARDE